jgi:hypothetical protein
MLTPDVLAGGDEMLAADEPMPAACAAAGTPQTAAIGKQWPIGPS